MQERSADLGGILEGAVDLHLHAGPSIFPRAENDVEVTRSAAVWGVAGFALKAHEGSSAERAQIANFVVPGSRAIGGIVLNRFLGGLNPNAVALALGLGARVVWLPTIHAANHIAHHGGPGFASMPSTVTSRPVEGISVLDSDGKLLPAVVEIVDLVRDAGAILATGHISPLETERVVAMAKERHLERVLVNHPDFAATYIGLEAQAVLAGQGAYLEFAVLYHQPEWGGVSPDAVVQRIGRIGASRLVLSSDYGQLANGSPWLAFARRVAGLLRAGLSEGDLDVVLRTNPRQLLV